MNTDEIRRIAEIMQKHELTEFSIESEDCKIKVRRAHKSVPAQPLPSPAFGTQNGGGQGETNAIGRNSAGGPVENNAPSTAEQQEPADTVDSPIVGTFYGAPSPDSEPFIKVGDEVNPDTVVCIIEAMKVMNEIKAEKSGRIKKILVENAQPVEFGQPLFELE